MVRYDVYVDFTYSLTGGKVDFLMLALEYSETVSVLLHRSMDDVWKIILFRGIISQPECSFLLCSVYVCLFSKSSQGQWQWLNIDVIMVRLEMWVTCCGLVYSSPGCLGRKWKKNVGLHFFDFKKCRKYIYFFYISFEMKHMRPIFQDL